MSKFEKRLCIIAIVFVAIYIGAIAMTIHSRVSNEEKIIDLLEKNLIVQLYTYGATRDQIAEILKVGALKVTSVIKHLKKGDR